MNSKPAIARLENKNGEDLMTSLEMDSARQPKMQNTGIYLQKTN